MRYETPHWEDDVPATRGRRALKHAGRGARFFLFAAVPFVVLFALAAALAVVRLQHGPISLSFLVSPLERSINASLDGYVADIEDAIVMFTDNHRLEFRLQNIRFSEPDGDVVASAPLASLEISRQALMQAQLAPSRVELIRPELYLTYAPQKGLSLSFSALREGTQQELPGGVGADPNADKDKAPAGETKDVSDGGAVTADAEQLKTIDFGKLLRRTALDVHGSAGAGFLKEFGVRDAILHVVNQGHRTTWQLPEVNIDVDQRGGRSVISGRASIASGEGAWRVAFYTEDVRGQTTIRASVRDLVPAALFEPGSGVTLLSFVDVPVGADVTLAMSSKGSIEAVHVDVGLGSGNILIRDDAGRLSPVPVHAGRMKLTYDPAKEAIAIAPSTLQVASAAVTFEGQAQAGVFEGKKGWTFRLASTEGTLGTGEFSVPPIALDHLSLDGRFIPAQGLIQISNAQMQAGGAKLVATAEASVDASRPGVRLQGASTPLSVQAIKAIWPAGLAPESRKWVGENVISAQIERFEFKRETGVYAAPSDAATNGRASLVVEVGSGAFKPTLSMPTVDAPRALITLENDQFELTIPEGTMRLPSGKTIALNAGQLISENINAEISDAKLSFKASSDVMAFTEVMQADPIRLIDPDTLPFKDASGKMVLETSLEFPMHDELKFAAIKKTGTASLKDGRIKDLMDAYDVQGASVAFAFSDGAIDAKGEAIVKGVLAKISWQHIFGAPDDRQPPLRITATLDNTDRRQLGFDLDHLLQGVVPVDLQVVPGTAPGERKLHVRADLSGAELKVPAIGWRKAPGRSAFAEFDIATAPQGKQELQNLRIAGDNIAVEGWASLTADHSLSEFYFPNFSVNVVTRLDVQGRRGANDIWDIKVRGSTLDGRDYFRSLFTVGRGGEGAAQSGKGGVNVDAQIDNVLGFSDTSLRGLKVKIQTRNGKLAELDARGTYDDTGAPLAVVLDRDSRGRRRIRADSTDAGRALKLIGFYPNMQNGRVRLELNVDASGDAEKSGTLWVEDFRVLGDPIVSEVVSSGVNESRPSIGGKTRVVREVFQFDTMRVPFSIGHGQFVMNDAYMKGPLLGGTLRGKVDFNTSKVNLGGTYIPLQGLNNAFGQIPLLGQILSGPRGEGIFGITFAVTGATSDPQVIVNPLSLVAPGIFREIFQMTNPSPKVQVVTPERDGKRRRKNRSDAPSAPGTTIDGWSSDTKRK